MSIFFEYDLIIHFFPPSIFEISLFLYIVSRSERAYPTKFKFITVESHSFSVFNVLNCMDNAFRITWLNTNWPIPTTKDTLHIWIKYAQTQPPKSSHTQAFQIGYSFRCSLYIQSRIQFIIEQDYASRLTFFQFCFKNWTFCVYLCLSTRPDRSVTLKEQNTFLLVSHNSCSFSWYIDLFFFSQMFFFCHKKNCSPCKSHRRTL